MLSTSRPPTPDRAFDPAIQRLPSCWAARSPPTMPRVARFTPLVPPLAEQERCPALRAGQRYRRRRTVAGPLWHDLVVPDAGEHTGHIQPGRNASSGHRSINRTQGLVLGFFVLAWVMLAVILVLSRAVREETLRRMPGSGTPATLAFLAGLLAFLAVLSIGVVRRWRWLFWLLLLAFAVGLVRVPLAVLQLSGQMAPEGPDWYVVLQGIIGVVQAGLAWVMFTGYRRAGPWGAF